MAITDIPVYVPAAPDDLIRSEDINNVQRLVRNSTRSHRHTRVANAPVIDTAPEDFAVQVGTQEIVDLAVTGAKLAGNAVIAGKIADAAVASSGRLTDNAVSTTRVQDAAVTAQKLAPNAVARGTIQDSSISRLKLGLVELASGTTSLAALGSTSGSSQTLALLRTNVPDTANLLFWPQLTLVSVSGGTVGFGAVDANIVYRRAQGTSGPVLVDVLLRLTNTGQFNCNVSWRVMTFAPFSPPYAVALRAGIGGELV